VTSVDLLVDGVLVGTDTGGHTPSSWWPTNVGCPYTAGTVARCRGERGTLSDR